MSTSDFILDVSEADFEYQVIAYSQQVPVVVDFWAEWCVPCRTLGPALEKLAEEGNGSFRLAKINVDENQNLALRYNVRSIPSVKAFRDGQVISEFVGVQPQPKLIEFIRTLAPSKADLLLEKGQSLLKIRQPANAEKAFRSVLEGSPDNTTARLGLIKSMILQGRIIEAQKIVHDFPMSKELRSVESLLPLINEIILIQTSKVNEDDSLEPAYQNALRLVSRGNIQAALDGLLDILRQDKHYRSDNARKVTVALFELMDENDPATRQYRNELASILF